MFQKTKSTKSKGLLFVAGDHAGLELKNQVVDYLLKEGYEIQDCGPFVLDKFDDYVDYVAPLAAAVANDPSRARGIILAGSGQGEAILANKFPGVRCALFYGYKFLGNKKGDIVSLSREHNNSNILSIGARFVDLSEAKKAIKEWLETPFTHEYRHVRRLKKIDKIAREIRLKTHF